ncbi:glycosyltransferase family 2 protein [Pseudoalteromonas sp. S554]|uniref:glycosyltransferase family 2 protein n=1 Tax=Pseudoalteromonas sp. S554 TaxID=2066516 RepID=UPI00110CB840|nr:glycosyltransferase family 2 protein [Pseudoalteromonas sp. S554]TMS79724.1 hypothetical protein CWB65_18720 [Pseudoalteromonas sp. S554]
MILVSVIIPFYSSTSGLLIKAVESALNQTIENLEVIIVDDCSPIVAKDEIKAINDDRVRIITHLENSNGGIARNTGIEHARGDYIAFLDYDDIWYKDKLEKQHKLFSSKAMHHKDLVIYSRCKIIDGNRVLIRPTRSIKETESVGEYLFCAKQIIQTSGIFLKTNLARKVMFDDLKRHQDYQFCLSLESEGANFLMLEDVSYEFVQIPKLNDYHFSLKWLELYAKYLNQKSIKGFKTLVILRSMVSHHRYLKSLIYSIKNNILISFFDVVLRKVVKKCIFK